METPVGRLMHDFYCTKSEDMYSKVLADEVKYLKETEGGRGRMCRVLDEMCEEVAKETAERVVRDTAYTFNDTGNTTVATKNPLSIE